MNISKFFSELHYNKDLTTFTGHLQIFDFYFIII